MVNKIKFVGLSLMVLGVSAAAIGCTDAPMTSEEMAGLENADGTVLSDDEADVGGMSEEIESGAQALCSNGDGVNSAMAALAVAAAKELKRWNPTTDFAPGRAAPWYTTLTATGKARCGGNCWNTQAILDLQKAGSTPVKFDGVTFNANNFVSTLTARWNEQNNCELRGGSGAANCSAEQHQLTFKSSAKGACDTVFTFDAKSTTGGNLAHPDQLKNKLMFVGGSANPYLAFSSTGTTVSIDPTYGLDDDGTTSTGSCTAACTKMSQTSMAGQCCSCAGKTAKYVKAPFNSQVFLCQ